MTKRVQKILLRPKLVENVQISKNLLIVQSGNFGVVHQMLPQMRISIMSLLYLQSLMYLIVTCHWWDWILVWLQYFLNSTTCSCKSCPDLLLRSNLSLVNLRKRKWVIYARLSCEALVPSQFDVACPNKLSFVRYCTCSPYSTLILPGYWTLYHQLSHRTRLLLLNFSGYSFLLPFHCFLLKSLWSNSNPVFSIFSNP